MEPQTAGSLEPRQRWRLVVARDPGAPRMTQRDLAEAWESAFHDAGLPIARTDGDRSRPRISFGAPLPVDMAASAELIDIVLTERWPAWRLREVIGERLPAGWRLIEAYDVWLAGPPLAGRVAAADYRITLQSGAAVDARGLASAGARLLEAPRVVRHRQKGDGLVEYDLRPLLADIRVVDDGPPVVLVVRTRFDPVLGTGRPDEVAAALAEVLGVDLGPVTIARDRVLLTEDLARGD